MLFDQKTAVEQYGERKLYEGRAKGRAEGRAEGRVEGRAEGRAEGIFGTLASLVRDGILSVKDAAGRSGLTEAAFQEKLAELGE